MRSRDLNPEPIPIPEHSDIEVLRKPNRPKANNRRGYHRRQNKDNGILEIKKPTALTMG
jgi:hypothetical protein